MGEFKSALALEFTSVKANLEKLGLYTPDVAEELTASMNVRLIQNLILLILIAVGIVVIWMINANSPH